MQKNNLVIAEWSAEMMKKRVEQKFNKLGWFKCLKNDTGAYSSIRLRTGTILSAILAYPASFG